MEGSVTTDGGDVVLSGLSGRLPESDNIEEFARQLFAGVDLVTADDRRWAPGMWGLPQRSGKLKDLTRFDADFFNVSDKLADVMDPQMRLLLEVTHETIVDAGLNPAELRGSRTGVYVGFNRSESLYGWCDDKDKINGYVISGCVTNMLSNRISHSFDLNGPSFSMDVACASSINALSLAVNDIRAGRCNAALVAGVNLCLDPLTSLNYHRMTMLAPDGRCAAFDESGQGFVRSEAVVAVLLQRRSDARRVYCTVRGVCVNSDGYKQRGIHYPSGDMQRRVAQETLEHARLHPQDVVYVEAHGTGTKAGDPTEVNAIAELFCKDRHEPLLLGAVKSNMGHGEAASGMCSLVKIVLAMERGIIPGNLHYKNPNTKIPALSDGRIKVVDKNTIWQGGRVGLNSFGFGGTNAHAILEGGYGSRPPPAEYVAPRLVLASGRTGEAVKRLLRLAADHPRDAELHALLDAVHARAIRGHQHRGYAVIDPACGAPPVLEVIESDVEPRPLWFVFSSMGSQWAGMARDLLRLPAFAASITRSAATLKPYGVDLQYVITETDVNLDDLVDSFVSIVAVQVAMVDVLFELGLRPDFIIGHSLGEIACAYADGALTAEQAVMCAYWRGHCTLQARPLPGAMAAVGLSWDEASRRCPADIELACHNALDSVTVSGPFASMERFVEQLSADGVFVRMVNTGGVAFHSKYISDVAPLLHERLEQLIPEPKPRTARWLSSSIPQDQWGSELAKLSGAAYHVNNLLSPVRFADILALVPERALVVEVAPHALLQAVLKRALPVAAHVPLVRRNAPESLLHFLSAVGKVYAAGAQPQVSRLYPAVSWPVSRGTPGLASHIGWDHSVKWGVADFKTAGRTRKNIIEYDVTKSKDAFIAGHQIEDRVIFPGTGYLTMVWRTFAKMNNLNQEQVAVIFKNVNFYRATIVTCDSPLKFQISLLDETGEFEVCEGGEVVATGRVRLVVDPVAERLPVSVLDETEEAQDLFSLDSEDIYKEFHLRGYNYKGVFQGIKTSNARGTRGLLQWDDNWISFTDSMLQMTLIGMNTPGHLFFARRMQSVIIDPSAHRKAVQAAMATGGAVHVKRYNSIDAIVSGGVEFRGITTSLIARRANIQAPPKLEKYVFVPYDGTCFEESAHSEMHALTAAIQIVIENCGVMELKMAEPAPPQPSEALLLPRAIQVLQGEPKVRATATLAAGADAPRYAAAMDGLGIKVSNKDAAEGGLELNCHVVLGSDVLLQRPGLLAAMAKASTNFVLLQEPAGTVEKTQKSLLADVGLSLVSRAHSGLREIVLLRHLPIVPVRRVVVEIRDKDYTWMERLKDAMKRAELHDMRVYVWSREPGSGVQGLAKCLQCEPGGKRLRLYYLPEARDEFNPDAPAYMSQVQRDLAFNVLRAGVWGTFRHLLVDDIACNHKQVEHAYVDMLTRGDLSSLRWIESDMHYPTIASKQRVNALCHVYYASLNFRDIMYATGKLVPLASKGVPAKKEGHCLGMEFSGRASNGKRVMGIVYRGLATTVLAESGFMWEVPKQWSLNEAATVPAAYATAYYALCVRGRMREGETVLIHAGAGGVGLAAITVALYAGCTVFTTVGSPDKRTFLREHFPQLPEANIGNSRDCSFEQLVLRSTSGRGVDLVLNSLAGEHLQASIRCLAEGGRFLEIGMTDLGANTPLGMAMFLSNTTVHGVLLDKLVDAPRNHPEKAEILRYVAKGIATGVVQPLPAAIFANDQIEEAFRCMTTGKHIGKVLIRVREEDTSDESVPARLISAIPRTYMNPDKSYVLVGGLGGFGLELAEWLTNRGARTLILNSRRSVRTGYQAQCINRWRSSGVQVLVSTVDAATPTGARALLQEAAKVAPIAGIFNLAAVLHDAILENQTPDSFHAVVKPKTNVTCSLDVMSRELAPKLDYFVVFSSMSCGRGYMSQSNYGLANSSIERLCEQRRAEGLPGLAIQWGTIADVGMWVDMPGSDYMLVGLEPQQIASCLQALETLLALPHAVVSSMVLPDKKQKQSNQDNSAYDLVLAVANILGIRNLKKVSDTATFLDLGLDSLMLTEIKNLLERSYDCLLGIQQIRALTFGKLRGIAKPVPVPDNVSAAEKLKQLQTSSVKLVPEHMICKLPSQPPTNRDDKPIFMVHSIEGTVEKLRGMAACVRGVVYGLQCVPEVPLDNMAALARFYVHHMRVTQPHPPYTVLGYSFGAAIAFEIALQLQNDDCPTHLVLIEGSPAVVQMHTTRSLEKWNATTLLSGEAGLLAHWVHVCYDLDAAEVTKDLERLPNEDTRLTRVTEMIAATGARVTKDAVGDAARSMHRRLLIGSRYKPAARLRMPVTLLTARDTSIDDYGLQEVCAGVVRTRRITDTHHGILTGHTARAIADYVSDLLRR